MIIEGDINEVRKQIKKAKNKEKIIVLGRDIKFNRLVLENKRVDMLVLLHKNKKDRLKQRESGLNQVLCKIAKKNKITLAIDIKELKSGNKEEKSKVLARIMQNIKLIKKYKNKMKILNYNNESQAKSLLLTLGLNTKLVKSAF